jgi:hypothetical protein
VKTPKKNQVLPDEKEEKEEDEVRHPDHNFKVIGTQHLALAKSCMVR